MKIGLNLLPLVQGVGGAWHYVENLLRALALHDRDNQFLCFVTSASSPIVPIQENFVQRTVAIRAEVRPIRIAFENSLLPLRGDYRTLDCIHHLFGTLPIFGGVPSVVSVFDVMVFARPADFSPIKRSYLRHMRRRAAQKASVLAPMSNSTATAMHEWLSVPDERMVVIPPVSSPQFTRQTVDAVRTFRRTQELPDEFWLCVADAYPHKNLPGLLQALGRNLRTHGGGWPLIIRGDPRDHLLQQIQSEGLDGRVRFLPWLNELEMALLYSAASSLIFPTLYEGAGMPVLEAMACGCPVVASNIPTTREFAGAAALTFDPSSPEDIARAMRECEASSTLRADLVANGTRQSAQFRSTLSAQACHEAYRRAISNQV